MNYNGFTKIVGVFFLTTLLTNCATIMKGSKGDVFLINAPKDLKVSHEGERLSIDPRMVNTEAYKFSDAFKDEMSKTSTTYYSPGITLPNVRDNYVLTLEADGKRAEVTLNPTLNWNYFWLDLMIGGWIVDWPTGNWNDLKPEGGQTKVIDVSQYLK